MRRNKEVQPGPYVGRLSIDPTEFVHRETAAEEIGIGPDMVGRFVERGYLEPAQDSLGNFGVSRSSINRYLSDRGLEDGARRRRGSLLGGIFEFISEFF
jgi:hypothetical protein